MSYVLTVGAKYLWFWSLPKTSVEFVIDQNKLIPEFWYALSQYNLTWSLILAKHEVKRIEILVVVQDLELEMKRASYGFCAILGSST